MKKYIIKNAFIGKFYVIILFFINISFEIKINMIITTEEIPNKKIKETLGIARGSTVRARNIGRDFFVN